MPRTPQSFAGPLYEDQILFYDQYGLLPDRPGGVLYSDGYFYFRDAYGDYYIREVSPHIDSHLAEGSDSLYVISTTDPTESHDSLDGYKVGTRWLNVQDGYEYVLFDGAVGEAVWGGTTGSGGGSGLEENDHENLDTLTHDLVEDSYDEVSYNCYRVGGVVTYADDSKTTKLRESIVTYGNCGLVSKIEEIQYEEGGVEKYRVTEEYTYDNVGRITSVDRIKL